MIVHNAIILDRTRLYASNTFKACNIFSLICLKFPPSQKRNEVNDKLNTMNELCSFPRMGPICLHPWRFSVSLGPGAQIIAMVHVRLKKYQKPFRKDCVDKNFK